MTHYQFYTIDVAIYILADVNNDSLVDISDIVIMINIILGM